MSYNYRCGTANCRRQVTFKKLLEQYVRERKCDHCDGKLYRTRRDKIRNKKRTCECDGLHFPHRAGSTIWCSEHPTGPTDQDQEDRYG